MRQIRVFKTQLLEILIKNRDEHRDIFLAAQKAYREVVIKVLDEQLRLARDSQPFNLTTISRISAPQDHTADYDRAVRMLEMSVDETIMLDEQEFTRYVDDSWGWSRAWATVSSSYTTSPKLNRYLGDNADSE